MIRFIGKTLITAVAVLVAAYVLSGVHVRDSMSAVLVAAVLGLLNSFVKPILVIITIPITIFFIRFISVGHQYHYHQMGIRNCSWI